MRDMRALWSFILLLSVIVQATTGQAPGDEDDVCLEDVVKEEILMSSFNYRNLVLSRGGPWTVVNDDDNNDGLTFNTLTTVSKTYAVQRFALRHINNVIWASLTIRFGLRGPQLSYNLVQPA